MGATGENPELPHRHPEPLHEQPETEAASDSPGTLAGREDASDPDCIGAPAPTSPDGAEGRTAGRFLSASEAAFVTVDNSPFL